MPSGLNLLIRLRVQDEANEKVKKQKKAKQKNTKEPKESGDKKAEDDIKHIEALRQEVSTKELLSLLGPNLYALYAPLFWISLLL